MVEEVAAVTLELHQGGGSHANTSCCQHQAEATTSDREMEKGEQEQKKRRVSRCNHQKRYLKMRAF